MSISDSEVPATSASPKVGDQESDPCHVSDRQPTSGSRVFARELGSHSGVQQDQGDMPDSCHVHWATPEGPHRLQRQRNAKQKADAAMTEAERHRILETFKIAIYADPEIEIGPVTELFSSARSEIWIHVAGHRAYLGGSYLAALFTAQLSDWWILDRDGNLLDDDREWFESRAKIGERWEEWELPIFKQERRMRLAQNIQIATSDKLENEWEN